jgi:trehalose 6-phosphate phosphatase
VIDADATVAALTGRPDRTALLVDFDGSLAPIVGRADDARPLPGALSVLSRLATRLGRVAIVSGRPVGFLARHLGVDGVALVGLYGMERSIDGAYSVDPRVEPYRAAVAAATAELEARLPAEVVEPKAGLSVTLHWRPAPEQADTIREIARDVGRRHGLAELRTRMAIELRPPIDVDKSGATRALVEGFEVGAFAGDDRGDLPAFAAVRDLRARGVPGLSVCSASAEAPGVAAEADLVVDGPAGVVRLLEALAATAAG